MAGDKLISYDLFGTLIDWKTGSFDGVIQILQSRLEENRTLRLAPHFVEQFCIYRKQAVNLALNTYVKAGVQEISLEQIYQAILLNGFISEKQMQGILNMEIALWKEQLRLVDVGIGHLQEDLQSDTPVIIVADSILGEEVLRPWLQELDPIFGEIRLCLSVDYKKRSSSGSLFALLRDEHRWKDFEGWRHKSTVAYPCEVWLKQAGMQFEKFDLRQLPRLEQDLLAKFPFDATLQCCTGITKSLIERKNNLSIAEAAGNSLGGTLLTVYVQWLLQTSLRKGIKRLYFIARDGYILKQMADILIKAWSLPLKTYYIYGSRKAWRMPSFDGTEESLRLVILYSNANNLRALAGALGISAEVFQKYFSGLDVDEKFTTAGRIAVARKLCRDDNFRSMLREKYRSQRESVIAYLKQEIDTSDDAFAFVEINGTGFTQQCLSACMMFFYEHPIKSFYFNIYRMWPDNPLCQYMVFLPGPLKNSMILEPLTRALHGSAQKYECRAGVWEPVLLDDAGCILSDYGYQEYIEGCLAFCRLYAEYANVKDTVNLAAIIRYIEEISNYVQEDVIRYIVDMPYNHFGRKDTVSVFAPLLSREDIRNIFLLHRLDVWEEYYKGADLELSIARCALPEQRRIAFYRRCAYAVTNRFKSIWKRDLVPERKRVGLLQDFPLRFLGARFVIYGAGIYGTRLYEYIKKQSGVEVVGWVDKNFAEKKAQGLPVTGNALSLKGTDFDVLFLAIVKRNWAEEARRELLALGIEERKIYDFFTESDYLS